MPRKTEPKRFCIVHKKTLAVAYVDGMPLNDALRHLHVTVSEVWWTERQGNYPSARVIISGGEWPEVVTPATIDPPEGD